MERKSGQRTSMPWRLRAKLVWESLVRPWHRHVCEDCREAWFCQGRRCHHYGVSERCSSCEGARAVHHFQSRRVLPFASAGRAS